MICTRYQNLLRAVRIFGGLDDASTTLRGVPPSALEEAAASRGWVFRQFVRLRGETAVAGEQWMRRGSPCVFIPSDVTMGDFSMRVAVFCEQIAQADGCTPVEVLADVFEAANDASRNLQAWRV